MILNGDKTVETRTYPAPKNILDNAVLLIETPGKTGTFKSRVRAIIRFTGCFQYDNESAFYEDFARHRVSKGSKWEWSDDKGKWGWEVSVVKVFEEPIPLSKRTGIRYSKDIYIDDR